MGTVAIALTGCATPSRLSSQDQQRVAKKTFVITGASSGFGQGVALRLASYGANVVLAARRTELLEEVARGVSAAGGTPLVVTTDVGRPGDVERLAQAAITRFGRIDVWINDAGVGAIGRFWDVPLADYSRLIDINLKGVIYGSYAAIRQFRAQGYGTLVNIGSVDSEMPLAYQGVYSASKAAVFSLGRVLNQEIRLSDVKSIHVATIMPWAADTPWWEHAANYSGGTQRMAPVDDPQKVVDAIVWASLHPKEAVPVGGRAQASYVSHRLLPRLTENIAANLSHREQMEKAAPAPPTSGTLHHPMESGRTVEGGVRDRMKREDQERRERGKTNP